MKRLFFFLPALLTLLWSPQTVSASDPEPAFPVDGGIYYIASHANVDGGKLDRYIYDDGANLKLQGYGSNDPVSRSGTKAQWRCTVKDNGKYVFQNVATGRYWGYKTTNTAPYELTIQSDRHLESTYYAIYADAAGKYLIPKCDGSAFDHANGYNYNNATFSGYFLFSPLTDEEAQPFDGFSASYGEKWVRIQNGRDRDHYIGLNGTTVQPYALDLTNRSQLWCMVGTAESFKLYNYSTGDTQVLKADGTASGSSVSMTTNIDDANSSWTITTNSDLTLAISPKANTGISLNPFGGKGYPIKFYGSGDAGSKWLLESASTNERTVTITFNRNGMNPLNTRLGSLNVNDGTHTALTALTTDMFATEPAITKTILAEECTITYTATYSGYTTTVDGDNIVITPDNSHKTAYLFYNNDNSMNVPFRIPAIATLADGTLLAVSDLRPCGNDIGFGRVDLVCKTSTDNGDTWSEMQTIAQGNGVANNDDPNNPLWKCGFGDAALCVDSETGKIVIMCVAGRVVYGSATVDNHPDMARIEGTYNPATHQIEWSEPELLTSHFYSLFDSELTGDNQLKAMFIGSGRLFQSRVTKTGSHYRLYAALCARPGGNRVVYSDDLGHTWTVLGGATAQPAINGDEPKCEELPDGSVILSSRKSYGRYFNIFTFADDSKTTGTWGEVADSNVSGGLQIGSNSTNGDILYLPITRGDVTRHFYLQSVPAGNGRSNVSIYRKEIDPNEHYTPATFAQGWTRCIQASTIGSAYSAMTLQQDGTLGFFYEEEPGGYCMVYKNYTMQEVISDEDFNSIQNLSQLSNQRMYYIKCERGYMYSNADQLSATGNDATPSSECLFAIINEDGHYYLCDIASLRFVKKSGAGTTLGDENEEWLTFTASGNSAYPWHISITNENGPSKINHNGSGAIKTDWETADAGNRWTIVDAGKLELATPIIEGIESLEQIKVGTKLGEYNGLGNREEIINAANAAIQNLTGTPSIAGLKSVKPTINAIQEYKQSLSLNMPTAGTLLRLRGATHDRYMIGDTQAVGNENRLRLTSEDATTAKSVFYFDGTNMISYQTGLYMNDRVFAALGTTADNAPVITFGLGTTAGSYRFKAGSNYGYNANANHYMDRGNNPGNSTGYDWALESVTHLPVTIGASGYSTLYVPFQLTLPADVKAYTATLTDEKKLMLTATEFVPALTPVILSAAEGTYQCLVGKVGTEGDETALSGSLVTLASNETAFTLGESEGKPAFLPVAEGETLHGFAAYLTGEAGVAAYPCITGNDIEDAIGTLRHSSDAPTYDIAGRRIERATRPDLYITQGRKVARR